MPTAGLLAGALLALVGAGCGGSSSTKSSTTSRSSHAASRTAQRVFHIAHATPIGGGSHASRSALRLTFTSLPVTGINRAHSLTESAKGQTVPLWQGTTTAFGNPYRYVMVGADPFGNSASSNPTVPVDLVPVKLEFLDSANQVAYTFDPGVANTDCGMTTSPVGLMLQSPLFQTHDYVVGGVKVGTVQYGSAFMREEFAKQALGSGAPNPGYGVTLSATAQPEITITVPPAGWKVAPASGSGGGQGTGACNGQPGGDIGLIDITTWDSFVKHSLVPQLQAAHVTSSTHLLDFLLGTVILTLPSGGQAGGYHSGTSTPQGVQYFVTALYGPPGLPPGLESQVSDIAPMSHELGEWLNDPSGVNPTPGWGHLRVVSGCQDNLEVGDPLAGITVPVTMANGVTYHPQELAFSSWFYRERTAGINGWYSSNGTFRSPQGACT